MMNTGNRLRLLRAEHRLSQYAAAVAAGVSHNRYWRIENGYTEPTDAERAKLAGVFGVSVSRAFPRRKAA